MMSKFTVTVTSEQERAAAAAELKWAELHNPNFGNRGWRVEDGDHLSVDCDDEILGAMIFAEIVNRIDAE